MQFYLITYSGRPFGESGELCKSNYDLEPACIKCGTGAKLKGSLKVKGVSNIKKDFFETLDGDYLISSLLYKKIVDLHPEIELTPAVDTYNKETEYFHFYSHSILPRFEKKSSGYVIEDQCPQCKRNGYYNDVIIGNPEKGNPTVVNPVKLYYKESGNPQLSESYLLQTWERLGLSKRTTQDNNVIRYARPWIVVNDDIKGVFESQGLRSIKYEEIIIE